MTRIYFDHNATTAVEPAVLDAMLPCFSADFANASSIHAPGQRARAAIETARGQVAALLGAKSQEIVFTSGGTESDNHAVFGAVAHSLFASRSAATPGASQKNLPHVITTSIEHEAVHSPCQHLEESEVAVTYLPVSRDGVVDPEHVRRALRPETVLITVMHANNELGTIQPIAEISRIAREHKVTLHTDAVQSAGKIPIDVNALGVDLLSISGHKLYAPKGVGALYVRTGTRLDPLIYGGHHQRGFRPGTENVAGIVGLGKAAELARQSLAADAARVSALRDRLERGILERIPQTCVNGARATRTPNTANIQFSGVEGEALVIALDLKGLACSAGAACSSGAVEPSHVLTAIGLSRPEAKSCLRFSLGRHTTESEIDFALEAISSAVAQLRAISPILQNQVATHHD